MEDFDDELKNLNKQIAWNKTKYVLVENELKKLPERKLKQYQQKY